METKNELVTPFGFGAVLRSYDYCSTSHGDIPVTCLEIDAGYAPDSGPVSVTAMIGLELDAMKELRDAVIAHIAHREKLSEAKVGAGETAPSA